MKFILSNIVLFAVLSFSVFAVADISENSFSPQREPAFKRVCRINQGQYWAVKLNHNDVALCRFGKAAIGAGAFFDYKTSQTMTESMSAYLSSTSSVDSCDNCVTLVGTDSNGVEFKIYQFADGSAIEVETLHRGLNSEENQELNKALSN